MAERHVRHDLLELATAYAEYSVLVTTAELKPPGPQILYANAAFTRMTGYSVSELLGKTPRILQGPKTDYELLGRLSSSLEAGHDFIARTTNYKQDGTPFELEWVISHLRNDEGETTHYIAVQRDITGQRRAGEDLASFDAELRTASRELVATMRDLEQAERKIAETERAATLGKMAAGVVHDLGNLLTPIFSLVKLLHNLDTLPPSAKTLTEHLDLSVEHAVQMLGNLRQYYTTGAIPVADELVELQSLIQKIPDLTQPLWNADGKSPSSAVNFAFDFQSPGRVAGNQTELLQVLLNLALNAMQVMPGGGSLLFGLDEDGDSIVVTVSDTGPGMSPDLMQRCFDPYVTGRSGGSGLGLSVCRQIVERHRGTIEAAPVEPTGVQFTIRLPKPQSIETVGTETAPHLGVLVIGAPESGSTLSEMLSRFGTSVAETTTADEGLQLFFEGNYQLVVVDTGLSSTTAFDVTQTLKRASPETAVVVLADDASYSTPTNIPSHLRPNAVIDGTTPESDLGTLLATLGLTDDA